MIIQFKDRMCTNYDTPEIATKLSSQSVAAHGKSQILCIRVVVPVKYPSLICTYIHVIMIRAHMSKSPNHMSFYSDTF